MKQIVCTVCGIVFNGQSNRRCCSSECSRQRIALLSWRWRKEHYANSPEYRARKRVASNKYAAAHREQRRARCRAYYASHRDELLAKERSRRQLRRADQGKWMKYSAERNERSRMERAIVRAALQLGLIQPGDLTT